MNPASSSGGDSLQPVPLSELRPLEHGRTWRVDQRLDDLESLTPVRGNLTAVHRGNVLEVQGTLATIVTLCCDRCLQHFNHPLQASAEELLWLGDTSPEECEVLELDPDALGEQLDPRGSFDPGRWAFEQLHLRLPLVNHCGADCPGPPRWGSDDPAGDPRWGALRGLQSPD
ncbi:MAG: YceD family protein [Synechococcus sp.]